jgi:hypothetical protein
VAINTNNPCKVKYRTEKKGYLEKFALLDIKPGLFFGGTWV